MSTVFGSLSMSLDGFIAGPNGGADNALGDNGQRLHQWVFDLESWKERQGRGSGTNNRDDEITAENFARAGAYVMGRRMFDEGEVG